SAVTTTRRDRECGSFSVSALMVAPRSNRFPPGPEFCKNWRWTEMRSSILIVRDLFGNPFPLFRIMLKRNALQRFDCA
ncbi:MAG: hypothetical protein WCD52_07155, partial [Xanthobacteraceae bacterium]